MIAVHPYCFYPLTSISGTSEAPVPRASCLPANYPPPCPLPQNSPPPSFPPKNFPLPNFPPPSFPPSNFPPPSLHSHPASSCPPSSLNRRSRTKAPRTPAPPQYIFSFFSPQPPFIICWIKSASVLYWSSGSKSTSPARCLFCPCGR